MLRQPGWHSGRLLQVWVSGHESGVSADELHSARMNVRQYVLREIIQTTRLWTPSYHWWCRNLGVHSSLKTTTKNVTWAMIPVKCCFLIEFNRNRTESITHPCTGNKAKQNTTKCNNTWVHQCIYLLITLQDKEWSWTRSRLICIVRMEGFPLKMMKLESSYLIGRQLHREMMEVCILSLKLYLSKNWKWIFSVPENSASKSISNVHDHKEHHTFYKVHTSSYVYTFMYLFLDQTTLYWLLIIGQSMNRCWD